MKEINMIKFTPEMVEALFDLITAIKGAVGIDTATAVDRLFSSQAIVQSFIKKYNQ